MTDENKHSDLIQFLSSSGELTEDQAQRVVEEVANYFNEPVPDYVTRRHLALRREGWRNEAIYQQVAIEITERPFAASDVSLRKIRRMIYGG